MKRISEAASRPAALPLRRAKGCGMNPPNLPDTARSILKAVIVSLGTTGLATRADVSLLRALLELQDA